MNIICFHAKWDNIVEPVYKRTKLHVFQNKQINNLIVLHNNTRKIQSIKFIVTALLAYFKKYPLTNSPAFVYYLSCSVADPGFPVRRGRGPIRGAWTSDAGAFRQKQMNWVPWEGVHRTRPPKSANDVHHPCLLLSYINITIQIIYIKGTT